MARRMRGEVELVFWLIVVILAAAAMRFRPDWESSKDLSGLDPRPITVAAPRGQAPALGGALGIADRQ